MEIYVQEMSAMMYLRRVPPDTRELVCNVAGAFPTVLAKSEIFLKAKIPLQAWQFFPSVTETNVNEWEEWNGMTLDGEFSPALLDHCG